MRSITSDAPQTRSFVTCPPQTRSLFQNDAVRYSDTRPEYGKREKDAEFLFENAPRPRNRREKLIVRRHRIKKVAYVYGSQFLGGASVAVKPTT